MNNKKVWFITGAGRGMGADFAKAALAAGHAVVATGRNSDAVSKVLGRSNDLLAVQLDVTKRADAEAAVGAAVDRFGRIDVLVNNAASFYAGYFEELTPEQFDRQLSVSLTGPMNVTRAVLPVMRKQHAGHIISISSSAGLAAGFDFVSAYAASKFGLEGWMEFAPGRGRAVWHSHHHRQSRILPHGAPHGAIYELRGTVDRGLRRTSRAAGRILEITERSAIWRPSQARASAHHDCQPGPTAAPLHRRCRCDCHCRAEDRRSQSADRGEPRPLDITRLRLSVGRDAARTVYRRMSTCSPVTLCQSARASNSSPREARHRTTSIASSLDSMRTRRVPWTPSTTPRTCRWRASPSECEKTCKPSRNQRGNRYGERPNA